MWNLMSVGDNKADLPDAFLRLVCRSRRRRCRDFFIKCIVMEG